MVLPVFYDFPYISLVLYRTNMAETPLKKLVEKSCSTEEDTNNCWINIKHHKRSEDTTNTAMATAATDAAAAEMRNKNMELMRVVDGEAVGYDFLIVCTSSPAQEAFWQKRLESVRGIVLPKSVVILAVHEDWPGGAGNGLGTLYAYSKAAAKASTMGMDLMEELRSGKSIALYHTAGKVLHVFWSFSSLQSSLTPAYLCPCFYQISISMYGIIIGDSIGTITRQRK